GRMQVALGRAKGRMSSYGLQQWGRDPFNSSFGQSGVSQRIRNEVLAVGIWPNACPLPKPAEPLRKGVLPPLLPVEVGENPFGLPVLPEPPPKQGLGFWQHRDYPSLGVFGRRAGLGLPGGD